MINTIQERRNITSDMLVRAKAAGEEEFKSTKAAIDNVRHSYRDPKMQVLILKQMRRTN